MVNASIKIFLKEGHIEIGKTGTPPNKMSDYDGAVCIYFLTS
jgi:hypothetical protein